METNIIICGNCIDVMKTMPKDCIDLTVTSPPYDDLRNYNGYTFDYRGVLSSLYRVTKLGGVVVWIVGDKTINGSESLTSHEQAIYAKSIGFNVHDTMIYLKENPVPQFKSKRYTQAFEFMFVFSKGKPNTCNYLTEPCMNAGKKRSSGGIRKRGGEFYLSDQENFLTYKEEKIKTNVWSYLVGSTHNTKDKIAYAHPATFPEGVAADHILSWSNQGDIVLDPMCGSGTTLKMAKLLGRNYIGIDISEEYCEIARQRTVQLFD